MSNTIEIEQQEIMRIAESYRLRMHRKQRAHYLASRHEHKMHLWLGVPSIITSTIVGTTIFASLSQEQSPHTKLITGFLSVASALLSALQTYFERSKTSENHKFAAAEYAAIKRDFDLFKLKYKNKENPDQAIATLYELKSRMDKLEVDSPNVSDHFYDKAVKEQSEDKEGI